MRSISLECAPLKNKDDYSVDRCLIWENQSVMIKGAIIEAIKNG